MLWVVLGSELADEWMSSKWHISGVWLIVGSKWSYHERYPWVKHLKFNLYMHITHNLSKLVRLIREPLTVFRSAELKRCVSRTFVMLSFLFWIERFPSTNSPTIPNAQRVSTNTILKWLQVVPLKAFLWGQARIFSLCRVMKVQQEYHITNTLKVETYFFP